VEVDELKSIVQDAFDGAIPDDEGTSITHMMFDIPGAKYDDDDGAVQLNISGVQDAPVSIESQAEPVSNAISVHFHFTCREFSKGEIDGDGKETEHHVELRLAGMAMEDNPFHQAISDHDQYYPNHLLLDIHIGGMDKISPEELKKNPIAEGKPIWHNSGQIEP